MACGVSQPTVSDWVAGNKRPRPSALLQLCRYLELDLSLAAEAVGYSAEAMKRLEGVEPRDENDTLSVLEELSKLIPEARFGGSPQVATSIAETICNQLGKGRFQASSESIRNKSVRLHACVLAEQGRVLCETIKGPTLVRYLSKIVDEVSALASENNDLELVGLAKTLRGGLRYSLGCHQSSFQFHLDASKMIKNKLWRVESVRAATVAAGAIGSIASFRSSAVQAMQALEAGVPRNWEAFILEGVARGQSAFDLDQSWARLDDAHKACDQAKTSIGGGSILREIQITRSRLELLLKGSMRDRGAATNMGDRCIFLAVTCGYHRYADEIRASLAEMN